MNSTQRTGLHGLGLAAAIAALAGCSALGFPDTTPTARVELQSRSGSSTSGTATLTQDAKQVVVRYEITGLKPNGEHGFHVHEKGDCSAADGTSAGGHFNPAGKPHGPYGMTESHAGDMPNLRADASGVARGSFTLEGFTVGGGGPADVLGRSMVVHRDPDDYKSQPAGNSGPRIACGLIVAVKR